MKHIANHTHSFLGAPNVAPYFASSVCVRRQHIRNHQRKGAAMVLAIFALLVVGTTTLAFTASRQTAFLSSRNAVNSIRVRELADSGLDIAKAILRSDATSWRTNHSSGKLFNNYALDGGTITVSLIDILKRESGASAAMCVPISTTTDVEITVTANLDGATWTSVSNMSIPEVVKGQYAIFANKLLWIYGANNQVGRWNRSPLASEKRRVNIGTQADFAFANFSGVWIDSDVQFESEVLPLDATDPRTLKSTWVYYPYNGGTNTSSSTFPINGPGRDKVAAVRMSADESIRMAAAPAPVAAIPAQAAISGGDSITSGTRTLGPFRVGTPTGSTNNNLTTNNCTLLLTAGTYEIYGSWNALNATIRIQGAVKIVVSPKWSWSNWFPSGINWTNTTVELTTDADLEVNNGYSLTMNKCWIGSYYQCVNEPDPVKAVGDPHMKAFQGKTFQKTACDEFVPDEPRYMQPWHVRIYPIKSTLSALFVWNLTDTSVVGSLFLPNNTVRFNGNSQMYGRIAADSVFIDGTSRFRYDHALDDIVGLTEGRAPNRGGDPEEIFPIRPIRWGADKGTGP
jgi:hypothetical protein